MTYYPDKFAIIKIITAEDTIFKVFASFYGGYLNGDSWKINSGIDKVHQIEGMLCFVGYSGSEYCCHPSTYGLSAYSSSILNRLISEAKDAGFTIELLEDTDWVEFFSN